MRASGLQNSPDRTHRLSAGKRCSYFINPDNVRAAGEPGRRFLHGLNMRHAPFICIFGLSFKLLLRLFMHEFGNCFIAR